MLSLLVFSGNLFHQVFLLPNLFSLPLSTHLCYLSSSNQHSLPTLPPLCSRYPPKVKLPTKACNTLSPHPDCCILCVHPSQSDFFTPKALTPEDPLVNHIFQDDCHKTLQPACLSDHVSLMLSSPRSWGSCSLSLNRSWPVTVAAVTL